MSYFFAEPKLLWFIIGLAFIAAEFAIPGVTLVFFGIGAFITAGFLFLFPLNLALQVCIFTGFSMIGLLFFRSRVKAKMFNSKYKFINAPSNLQPEVIGFAVDVIEHIVPPHPGRVLLHGTSWQANALVPISKGARVKITGRDGLIVIVEPVN